MLHVMVKEVLQLWFINVTCCNGQFGTSVVVHQFYILQWSRRNFSCGSSMLHVAMVKAVLQLWFINVTCCYGQGGTSVVDHQCYMLLYQGGTSVVVHQCYMLLWSRRYFSCN